MTEKTTCGTGKQKFQYTVSVLSHPTHRYWGRREGEAAGNFFFCNFPSSLQVHRQRAPTLAASPLPWENPAWETGAQL